MRLSCADIGVTFPSPAGPLPALRGVSFAIASGEFVSVVGPSGCGKTTLLRVLAGMLTPQEGVVERIPVTPGADGLILLVFQENSLFPWMTVLENAAFGLRMQGYGKQEREARALELLRRFGLAGREHDYPHQLSLGMKQRVAVMRCFLSNPAVLLMDEPFAALDYQTRMSLHQELLELWEQHHRTVLYVTHDVEEAILLSDRILVLDRQPGTVVAEYAVPFPRPREPSVMLGEEFLLLKRRIWARLGKLLGEREGPAPRPEL
jgi:NitT/TauT family transport system ATP-binding protein